MAVIGKIRQRSGLLIFLIGLSIVGFLIMDATNSQGSILKGRKDTVGSVDGEKIGYNDFTKKYEENVKGMEDQMRGQALSEDQRNGIRNQTWDEMVKDIIFQKVYSNIGIGVTGDELTELVTGENASPYIQQDQQFRNPQTGQFDPQQVRLYLQRLDQDPQGVEPGTVRRQWLRFEGLLKQMQYQQKYENLIIKGLYVPSWMAEMSYKAQASSVSFKYVQLPFSGVAEDAIKVSDDDLKKYLDDHAAQYKVEDETRKLLYVTFNVVASSSDSSAIVRDMEEKLEDFAKAGTVSEDSVFLKMYSETPFDEVYYDKESLNSVVKDSLFSLPVKSIVGPYAENGSFKLAKISDRKMISDSVKVRDIKISFEGITSQEQANEKFALVDSLFKAIDSLKGDFAALAAAYSDDPMSKLSGGNIGWVKQGEKETMYNNTIFYRAQKGKLYRIPTQGENAIHLVQVVEDKPSKTGVLVSYFTRQIIPSSETERNIYGLATAFASENADAVKFTEAAKKQNGKTVNTLKKDAYTVEGLGTARELVKWAFNAKVNDVSSVFTVDNKHVIALLQQVNEKGTPSLDAVKEFIRPLVVNGKKAEVLSKKVEEAKASNIDDLGTKLGAGALFADRVSFSRPDINGSSEPAVVGTAFATSAGKMSPPIKGNDAVYVVSTVSVEEAPKQNDYSIYAFPMAQQMQNKARYAQEVQKKLANITDDRFSFF